MFGRLAPPRFSRATNCRRYGNDRRRQDCLVRWLWGNDMFVACLSGRRAGWWCEKVMPRLGGVECRPYPEGERALTALRSAGFDG